jgi:apolipoprotein N-acyltransferase
MEARLPPTVSERRQAQDQDRVRKFRVVGFFGAGAFFLVSQLGLLWVLSSGGVGNSESVANLVWLTATLGAGLFLFLLSDSYRRNPAWPIANRST